MEMLGPSRPPYYTVSYTVTGYSYTVTVIQLQLYSYSYTVTVIQLQLYSYSYTVTVIQLQLYRTVIIFYLCDLSTSLRHMHQRELFTA